MYDAIVIGGGVVGISVAYHLVRHGAKTLLIDRQDPGRSTDAGAGILAPETSGYDSEALFDFAVEAGSYYPTLIQQLRTEQTDETGYARCGKLTVAVDEDELEPFERTKRLIFQRQQRRRQPTSDKVQLVSAQEAQALFPALASVRGAIYCHQAAQVDGRLLAQALRRAAEARGLVVEQSGADRLTLNRQTVTGVLSQGKTFGADMVVIAGGAWSQEFGTQLGVRLPVEPQRGQILHLSMVDVETGNWPIVSAFHGHYILARPGGHIVVGATRETGSGFKPHSTAAGIYQVLSEALRVAPGLAQAELNAIRVGLRPLTTDQLPILGRVPGHDSVYLATGHGASGLLLGPYSGKIVAEMMLGREVHTDITEFDIARFL